LKDAQSRAGKEFRQRATELEREVAHLKTIQAGSAPNADEVSRLKAEIAAQKLENDSIKLAAQKQARDTFITGQAVKQQFIDPSIVVRLTADNIRTDGTNYTVVDDSGNPRTAADGTPLTPDAFYAEYATARPYLVKGQVKSGGGGTSSSGTPAPTTLPLGYYFGPGSNSAAVNALSIRDPQSYKRLRAEAQKAGLV
jgi:hypothetical protein